ncbi:uncharacterized protein LOC129227449 isoform X2 [Uloborus diversus]|uniref:uncharacterized protein LOC129227449 isoform X2 n=1 Tax=Uloborus diversus TaxID=327109 RepID=UPI002409F585|nr:uncharacterized protein LOC129227449 isoform X2 [Uloborus diversus]
MEVKDVSGSYTLNVSNGSDDLNENDIKISEDDEVLGYGIESAEKPVDSITRHLRDELFFGEGVHGLSGSGETSISKAENRNPEVDKFFEERKRKLKATGGQEKEVRASEVSLKVSRKKKRKLKPIETGPLPWSSPHEEIASWDYIYSSSGSLDELDIDYCADWLASAEASGSEYDLFGLSSAEERAYSSEKVDNRSTTSTTLKEFDFNDFLTNIKKDDAFLPPTIKNRLKVYDDYFSKIMLDAMQETSQTDIDMIDLTDNVAENIDNQRRSQATMESILSCTKRLKCDFIINSLDKLELNDHSDDDLGDNVICSIMEEPGSISLEELTSYVEEEPIDSDPEAIDQSKSLEKKKKKHLNKTQKHNCNPIPPKGERCVDPEDEFAKFVEELIEPIFSVEAKSFFTDIPQSVDPSKAESSKCSKNMKYSKKTHKQKRIPIPFKRVRFAVPDKEETSNSVGEKSAIIDKLKSIFFVKAKSVDSDIPESIFSSGAESVDPGKAGFSKFYKKKKKSKRTHKKQKGNSKIPPKEAKSADLVDAENLFFVTTKSSDSDKAKSVDSDKAKSVDSDKAKSADSDKAKSNDSVGENSAEPNIAESIDPSRTDNQSKPKTLEEFQQMVKQKIDSYKKEAKSADPNKAKSINYRRELHEKLDKAISKIFTKIEALFTASEKYFVRMHILKESNDAFFFSLFSSGLLYEAKQVVP